MIKEFSGIHNHSHFSFLDGVATPDELIKAAKEKGLKSIAITEHGHAHSHADFYLAGKREGVRALLGVEGYIIHDLEEWHALKRKFAEDKEDPDAELDLDKMALINKENRRALNRKGHLVMVAQNRKGLANIYQIIHGSHKHGMYRKPRADKKMLAAHAEGVIASSACMGGVISQKLWQLQRGEADWSEIVKEAEEFQDIFGKGKFFLELQYNEHEGQSYINENLVRLHEQTGIPLIATADAHYVKPDDWETQQVLHMLMTHKGGAGMTMQTLPEGYDFKTRSLYVKSPEEMWNSYLEFGKNVPEKFARQAFENTLVFDSLVETFEPDTAIRLPTLPFSDTFRELGERAIAGLKAKGFVDNDEYKQRLFYELKMIKDKGISNYFIIMNDIVKEVSKHQLIGPGRGSAGGSLLCYLLGVTNIDPIEHKLMFERFINVDRCFVPDTVVLTERGPIEIKDVLVGDIVLSHKNEKRKVTNIFSYQKSEMLVGIVYDNSMFLCTDNHRLLLKNFDGTESFVEAGKLIDIYNRGKYCFLVDEEHNPIVIDDVIKLNYSGQVFDLEVEIDHTYQICGSKSMYEKEYKNFYRILR